MKNVFHFLSSFVYAQSQLACTNQLNDQKRLVQCILKISAINHFLLCFQSVHNFCLKQMWISCAEYKFNVSCWQHPCQTTILDMFMQILILSLQSCSTEKLHSWQQMYSFCAINSQMNSKKWIKNFPYAEFDIYALQPASIEELQ